MTIDSARLRRFAVGAVALGALAGAAPAFADEVIVTQDAPPPPSSAANQASAPAQTAPAQPQAQDQTDNGGGLELFSKNTITVMADLRLASTNGAKSFVNGGFGKTRFQGNAGGGYSTILHPC